MTNTVAVARPIAGAPDSLEEFYAQLAQELSDQKKSRRSALGVQYTVAENNIENAANIDRSARKFESSFELVKVAVDLVSAALSLKGSASGLSEATKAKIPVKELGKAAKAAEKPASVMTKVRLVGEKGLLPAATRGLENLPKIRREAAKDIQKSNEGQRKLIDAAKTSVEEARAEQRALEKHRRGDQTRR